MSDHVYRVRLPDGQVFDRHLTPERIRKEHPEALIEGRIVMDAVGIGVVTPFGGEQPIERTERLVAVAVEQEQAANEEARLTYEGKTVAELRAEADARGLGMPGTAKKADLIEALLASDQVAEAVK